ncbi:MAG: hypothetical protein R3B70_44060 [Polyangiaceae bacterium]
MKKSLSIACLVASSLMLAAAPALADDTAPAKPAKAAVKAAESSEKGYGYKFDDDPLQSGVSGTTGFVIKVRPKGAREVLLKPRVSFVPEMLKSVEAL